MVRGGTFFEKCKLFFSRIFDPPEKHENPPWTTPPEIQEPWDHAQMIERKILFRIALTRAPYDQIRPWFFQKYVFDFDPPSTAQNRDPHTWSG